MHENQYPRIVFYNYGNHANHIQKYFLERWKEVVKKGKYQNNYKDYNHNNKATNATSILS